MIAPPGNRLESGGRAQRQVDKVWAEHDYQSGSGHVNAPTEGNTNWLGIATLVSTIFLWVFSLIGSLVGMVFKTRIDALEDRMDGKLDHEEVSGVVRTSIQEYHKLFSQELKEESDRKHTDNQHRLTRIENILLDRANGAK